MEPGRTVFGGYKDFLESKAHESQFVDIFKKSDLCLACQRRTGSVFGAQARFLRQDVHIRGDSTAYLRVGDEGGKATFHFCPVCGSTVYYEFEGREESIAVPVGAFAEPSFPAPTFSVYGERMHAWVSLPENIEHMA